MNYDDLPSLDTFIEGSKARLGKNGRVTFPGFHDIYVRHTKRALAGEMRCPVLDLGQLEAIDPGKGAFTRLLKHIREKWPEFWIYAECVQTQRFATKLLTLGFTPSGDDGFWGGSPSFYLPPLTENQHVQKPL